MGPTLVYVVAANNALQVIFAFAFTFSNLPRALDGCGNTRPLLITFVVKSMFRCCEKSEAHALNQ